MSEVATTLHVYSITLAPAYEKRGWDLAPLHQNRKQAAIRFSDAVDSSLFTPQERNDYVQLLKRLGDSPGLRLQMLAVKFGAGALIRLNRHYLEKAKDVVKNLLDKRREQSGIEQGR